MRIRLVRVLRVAAALPALVTGGDALADLFTSTVNLTEQLPAGLQRFDEQTGVRLTAAEVAPGSVLSADPLFLPFAPSDLALGPDGNVYLSDVATGAVLRFDAATGAPAAAPSAGLLPGVFAQRPTPVVGEGEEFPLLFTSLAFDPGGQRLYVTDAFDVLGAETPAPGIRVYDPQTGAQVDTLLESPPADFEFASLAGLAFVDERTLLVSDLEGGTIYRVDPVDDTVSVFNAGGAATPAGLAVADTGEVFVADLFANRIVKIDPTGATAETFVQYAPPPTLLQSEFPSDLAFDSEGNLVVALLGATNPSDPGGTDGQLRRYDAAGNEIQTIATGLDPQSSVVFVPDFLPGDFNGDAVVDADDYVVWQDAFGQTTPPGSGADANGDGAVTAADYPVWRDTLGASGLLPAPAATPEPAAAVALLPVGLLAWGRRRR